MVAVCIFADIIVKLNQDEKFERFDFSLGGGFVCGILSFVVSLTYSCLFLLGVHYICNCIWFVLCVLFPVLLAILLVPLVIILPEVVC